MLCLFGLIDTMDGISQQLMRYSLMFRHTFTYHLSQLMGGILSI